MKKILLLLVLIMTISVFISCVNNTTVKNKNNEDETKPNEENEPKNNLSRVDWPDESKYPFFQVYDAPEGDDYRTIVMDHMLKMANIEWTPAENFTIEWKEKDKATFNANMALKFQKGKTYKGMPYGLTHASLELFGQHLDENNRYSSPTYYYEEIVGNHCSSSMMMAYQQIIDVPMGISLFPYKDSEGIFMFPTDLKVPEKSGWTSKDLHTLNGQQAIYEAYAALDKGDILYNRPSGAGHTRMVSRVDVSKSTNGAINPSRSLIYVVEQTDTWSSSEQNSTWWIDKSYTFKELFDKNFMPVTLNIFHEEDKVLQDAYIAYDGENTAKSITTLLNGTISSNFPLNYLKLIIENEKGEIVRQVFLQRQNKIYKYNLRNQTAELNASLLEKGNYKFIVKTGISRGGAIVETVDFTIE